MELKYYLDKYNIIPNGVIHIGSHYGEEAELYNALGFNKVLWIEADPDSFEKLVKNTKLYSNHFCFNFLLSEKTEQVKFFIANNAGHSSSIYPLSKKISSKVWGNLNNDKFKYLESRRFDEVFDKETIQNYNVLNIDVQGAELSVLKGMGQFINLFEMCVLEINFQKIYQGSAIFTEVDSFLNSHSFKRGYLTITDYQGEAIYYKVKSISAFYKFNNFVVTNTIEMLSKINFWSFVRYTSDKLPFVKKIYKRLFQ
jgi:FkbM family methyltransferase